MDKLKLLFDDYGTLEELKNNAYMFSCDSKTMFQSDNILYFIGNLNFLLLVKDNECFVYCFRVGNNKDDYIKDSILEVINNLNSSLEYGKYILDSDGDINWEYRFDINSTTSKDIYEILYSLYNNLLIFSVYLNEIKMKSKQSEENPNE